MIIKEKKNIEIEVVSGVRCDICGKEPDDEMDAQEMVHLYHEGGYASIFGDMSTVECDICQHCLEKKLGPYLRLGWIE